MSTQHTPGCTRAAEKILQYLQNVPPRATVRTDTLAMMIARETAALDLLAASDEAERCAVQARCTVAAIAGMDPADSRIPALMGEIDKLLGSIQRNARAAIARATQP